MADTLIALLRGINVGRAKRVAMADLRSLVEDLGYAAPRTLLNSGNVVFRAGGAAAGGAASAATASATPAAVAKRIEEGLVTRCAVSARVVVLTAEQLAVVVAENPLLETAADPSRLLVAAVADPADLARLEPLTAQSWAPEALAVGACAAYLWCPAGVIASRLFEAAGRALGDGMTTRNWTTVTKLLALAEEQAASRA